MTSIHKLNTYDLIKLQEQGKGFRLQHFLFLIFAMIISLLSGLLGIKAFGYLISVAVTFSFLVVTYLVMFIRDLAAYQKDIKQQEKVCRTLTVTSKSNKKNDFTFSSDLNQLRKISLFNKVNFDRVAIGDKLYIEFTKQSKRLLRLEKDGHDLLEERSA